MGRKLEVKETVHKDFNFCKAIFAPPSKWRTWHVPCLPYPRYATGLASVPREKASKDLFDFEWGKN